MHTNHKFISGINYWPIKKAMYWWSNFDYQEVKNDFRTLASYQLKYVRIFLNWEDFQPHPAELSATALANLQTTADLAWECGLQIMPTFFCGHMSGINWMPSWMLLPCADSGRFPVYSSGAIQRASIKNYYVDPIIREAQVLQVQEVCSVLKGHEAVFAYDLGNESSNCWIPSNREQAREWLRLMTSIIRSCSAGVPVTLGMHAEDLEEDRQLWPQDAAQYCDFLTMHAYPFYHSWVNNTRDVNVLPFMGMVTAWLGEKKVLLGEFGAPSSPVIEPWPEQDYNNLKYPLWTEAEVAAYYHQALPILEQASMSGALAWCFADYAPDLWKLPPLDKIPRERHFGLFRHDGTAKAAAQIFQESIGNYPYAKEIAKLRNLLDKFDRDSFYQDPKNNLQKLYLAWKQDLF